MIVEILAIEDCPNVDETATRTRTALGLLGRSDVTVSIRRISTRDDAAATAFAGSPTITVDGVDLFPSGISVVDLACRIYRTPDGIAGLPTVEQLIERMRIDG